MMGRGHGCRRKIPRAAVSDGGKQHLRTLGVSSVRPAAVQIATGLRDLLVKISDSDTRAFVEEAVQCYEYELYRSAIIMSWLAAMHVLGGLPLSGDRLRQRLRRSRRLRHV
jgi:hypothetical protein